MSNETRFWVLCAYNGNNRNEYLFEKLPTTEELINLGLPKDNAKHLIGVYNYTSVRANDKLWVLEEIEILDSILNLVRNKEKQKFIEICKSHLTGADWTLDRESAWADDVIEEIIVEVRDTK